MRDTITIVGIVAIQFAGCAEPVSISIDRRDYDRTCASNDDCTPARFRSVCDCPDGAVNVTERERMAAEIAEKQEHHCPPDETDSDSCDGEAFCREGVCDIRLDAN